MTPESLERVLGQMQVELKARSVIFLRSDGQVVARQGELAEHRIPQMAALVAAMAAASESVAELAGKPREESRLSLEFPSSGLYAVAVGPDHWVAVLYEGVLNPGLLRMQVRRFGQQIERLEADNAKVTPVSHNSGFLFENITDDEIDGLFGGQA